MRSGLLLRFLRMIKSRVYGKKSLPPTLLMGLFISGIIGGAFLQTPATTEEVNRYVVLLKNLPSFSGNSVGDESFDKFIKDNSSLVEDLYPERNDGLLGRYIIVTDKDNILSALSEQIEDVELVNDGNQAYAVEHDQVTSTYDGPLYKGILDDILAESSVTCDDQRDKTWGLRVSKTKEGLAALRPTRTVIVGVVDTGCYTKHESLKDNLVKGYNFAGGDPEDPSNRTPDEMHGTHVSGTIVAKPDSDGFFGIANRVAKVMPVRVLNEHGSGTLISVSRGIVYAADHGVHVINMSLGAPVYSRALHDAVKYAVNDKGVTTVCAAGNSNTSKPHFPGGFPEVIKVAATALKADGTEERAYFSNYAEKEGDSICSAPGHIIWSTLPDNKYGYASGTSMACPHVTGMAAVILSQGNFTPEEVKKIIETRGDELKTDRPIGKRINLLKFVQKAAHSLMPVVNDHPYDLCCIDAGIVFRFTEDIDGDRTEEYADGTVLVNLYAKEETTPWCSKCLESHKTTDRCFVCDHDNLLTDESSQVESSQTGEYCWSCYNRHDGDDSCPYEFAFQNGYIKPMFGYDTFSEIPIPDVCFLLH